MNTSAPWFWQWPAKWFEKAINEYLSLDPEISGKISELSGNVVCIEVKGLNKTLYLSLNDSGIKVLENFEKEPDTTISGTPAALFKMGATTNTTSLMLKGEVEIKGNTRLGRKFKSLLNEMEIDWEEQLSKTIGDIPAHQAMNMLTKLSDWGSATATSITADISEYLQEESRDIVSGDELQEFNKDVDQLRDSVDRLQARIKQLKK